MHFDVLTLFPKMFEPVLHESILGRAVSSGQINVDLHDIRNYADNKHRSVDDYPFGGGAGMVMMAQPVLDCMDAVLSKRNAEVSRIYLSPRGRKLDNDIVKELASKENILLLCGHYEGIDERILTQIDDQISIGDYVLTGGELAAMVLIDAVSRFIPGVLGHEDSAKNESFGDGLLEYPHYTRPAEFRGMKIPDILLSGHHAKIERWRREQSLSLTLKHRPDLIQKAELSKEDQDYLNKEI